jgi:AmmeMemoRadiSam system protein B
MGVRRPVVAGAFYPANPERLRSTIKGCFTHSLGPGSLPGEKSDERQTIGVVCPHAGYMYSGPTAAHSYLHLASEPDPDSVIILCPNHTGLGEPVSLGGSDAWDTPLGRVEVDQELTSDIFKASDIIDVNELAHYREHSIEVQLPFLQFIYRDFKIVPICMGLQDLETSRKVGQAIAQVVSERDVLLMASTDLTHQESQSFANAKDGGVIDHIVKMDEVGLQDWVRSQRVTMCGYGPVSAILIASKLLGAKESRLLAYSTSGDTTGDYAAVVGYASAVITR